MYLKIKGEAVNEIKKINIPNISILKPGLLTDRDDARTAEKIFKYMPFISKIKAFDLAKFCVLHAEDILHNNVKNPKGFQIYENKQLK